MDVELFVHAASDALTNETLRAFVDNYKTTVGGAEFTTDEIVTVQNKSVAKLNYTIQNDTTKELHHVLFFSMNDKATMVDFKYPSERSKEWDAICSYTLKSLEFTK